MDPQDGGFASRKFIFCVSIAITIAAVGILAGTVLPGVAAILPEIYGGLLGVVTVYLTGNISTSYLAAKVNSNAIPAAPGKAAVKSKPVIAPDLPEDKE